MSETQVKTVFAVFQEQDYYGETLLELFKDQENALTHVKSLMENPSFKDCPFVNQDEWNWRCQKLGMNYLVKALPVK